MSPPPLLGELGGKSIILLRDTCKDEVLEVEVWRGKYHIVLFIPLSYLTLPFPNNPGTLASDLHKNYGSRHLFV